MHRLEVYFSEFADVLELEAQKMRLLKKLKQQNAWLLQSIHA